MFYRPRSQINGTQAHTVQSINGRGRAYTHTHTAVLNEYCLKHKGGSQGVAQVQTRPAGLSRTHILDYTRTQNRCQTRSRLGFNVLNVKTTAYFLPCDSSNGRINV